MPLVRYHAWLYAVLLREPCVVHLIDVAVLDRETVAAAVDLHGIAEANGPIATENALRLDRATNPAELAVRHAKPIDRACADPMGADVLDAEVVDMHVVCAANCDAVFPHVELD